jgi:crotonobetainyl-CoA:carnitine CoA-transferase CaiB-like acyl-CoA transferase
MHARDHRSNGSRLVREAFMEIDTFPNRHLKSSQSMADVCAHPQLAAPTLGRRRDAFGAGARAAAPTAHDAGDARMDAVPALGEHTAALLAEIGLDAAAIERLREDGVI